MVIDPIIRISHAKDSLKVSINFVFFEFLNFEGVFKLFLFNIKSFKPNT